MADPFGSSRPLWHPSLPVRDHYKLPPDVFYPLLEDFLQDERYTKWAAGYKPWKLHCFGSPGCGKTTFAAMAVEKLRKRYQGTDVRLASIFIQDPVFHDHTAFIEDLLACVYSQLAVVPDLGNYTPTLPHDYIEACSNGLPFLDRVEIIRRELHSLLRVNQHNFLVLDGFDNLDAAARFLLDHELKHLRNLSLLVTRRFPASRMPKEDVICDHCLKTDLLLYWECQDCSEDETPQYCNDCHEASVPCQRGHSLNFAEPYSRVDMDISMPYMRIQSYVEKTSGTALDRYIEREVCNRFGLTENTDISAPEYVIDVAGSISEKSRGNINIAKLRLDELYAEETAAGSTKVSDRLPRSIIAYFDSEIARLGDQSSSMRNLALAAIAAVAEYGDGRGISVEELEQRTRTVRANHPIRSLEDILCAANGLLAMQPYDPQIFVACYTLDFLYYTQENYNEALYRAKASVDGPAFPEDGDATGLEELERSMAGMTCSPNISGGAFGSIKQESGGLRSGIDSGYGSASSSRQTTTNSDFPTLSTLNPDGVSGRIGIDLEASRRSEDAKVLDGPSDDEKVVEYAGSLNIRVCPFCDEQILRSEALQGPHHISFDSLRGSVRSRCAFCSDLYRGILSPSGKSSTVQDDNRWPQYYWNVRTTGRTDNGKAFMTVIFRATEGNSRTQQQLKVKTYHLLIEKAIGSIPTAATLGPSTNPNISGGAQLKRWIYTCNNSHPHCYKHRSGAFVPSRLVDLRSGDMIRVVDTRVSGLRTSYGTLSHSWGPPNFLILTQRNKFQLMGPGVRIDELSINFQQAIAVARFIGLDYIWIDSLCIIQGPDGTFREDGMLMHQVYRCSFCNIAIADSADSKGGIFRDRNPNDVLPASYVSDGKGKLDKGTWRILSADFWKEELLGTKLYTRGWVFQERMLSPRILHFAANQIFWDCSTLSACEVLPEGLPHSLDGLASTDRHWRGRIQASTLSTSLESGSENEDPAALTGSNDASLETFWQTALQNYTSCALTNQGDKTVAVWSIAKIVRDVLKEEYAGGMWEFALEEQLAWRLRDSGTANTRIPELQARNPSWTWASVKGTVVPHERVVPPRCYTVTGLNGQESVKLRVKEYADKDSEPQLASGTLEMAGYMGTARLKPSRSESKDHELELVTRDGRKYKVGGLFDVHLDEVSSEDDGPTLEMEFILLAASCISESGMPVDDNDEKEYEDEDINQRTYTGTALLLVSHKEYASRQYAKYRALLKEVVARSPNYLIPDPPYGTGKSLVEQTEDIRKLVEVLTSTEKREVEGGLGLDRCYRRAGVFIFQGMKRDMWKSIKAGGRTGIRLG
ncbi:HET-domain-containing protein [Westerdykella ornata]|uniref:HET-domain-containing protein n=1 Tax=Westerdykella ornata TaxID=318751 RepID=A0A6A6J578_WESOR|nr:HET-domain-containing protein [Westerdykella ornata]KAF2271384.1 HET-domain-containing protein [Westerdykella ornata]